GDPALQLSATDVERVGTEPVILIAIRENGPYAARGDLRLDGEPVGYRATLCRCGASRNKPYCDGSHHAVAFAATGEPPTESEAMLDVRNGVLEIDPQLDGPLQIRGNLEITSGTGRAIACVQQTGLCPCGASATKPFCDGSHARIGFRSTPTTLPASPVAVDRAEAARPRRTVTRTNPW